MIVSAPSGGIAQRALTLPRNGPIFGYWLVLLQISVAGNLFVGSSKQEAGLNINGFVQDGLQFNKAMMNDGPVQFWWTGELWVSSDTAGFQCIIVVPGQEPNNLPC